MCLWQCLTPKNEEAIRKIANPFREPGVANVNPALPLDESLKMMENGGKDASQYKRHFFFKIFFA